MNLAQLARFVPLIAGLFLAYHIIFKQNLPSKNLGAIATYFIGILIVFFAISLIITRFFAGWATDLLQAGTTSTEWQEFINESGDVIDDTFERDGSSGGNNSSTSSNIPFPTPTPLTIQIVTPTPFPSVPLNPSSSNSGQSTGSSQYKVVSGDTLYDIASNHNTTVDAIMQKNGLSNWTIQPGQILNIPASSAD